MRSKNENGGNEKKKKTVVSFKDRPPLRIFNAQHWALEILAPRAGRWKCFPDSEYSLSGMRNPLFV